MLKWCVLIGDWNSGKIEEFNIFHHYSFLESCKENYKKNKYNREAFEKELRSDLMYYYWSKTEWEVIVSHWPPTNNDRFKEAKIDVYRQVILNWNIFCDYVWNNSKELMKE